VSRNVQGPIFVKWWHLRCRQCRGLNIRRRDRRRRLDKVWLQCSLSLRKAHSSRISIFTHTSGKARAVLLLTHSLYCRWHHSRTGVRYPSHISSYLGGVLAAPELCCVTDFPTHDLQHAGLRFVKSSLFPPPSNDGTPCPVPFSHPSAVPIPSTVAPCYPRGVPLGHPCFTGLPTHDSQRAGRDSSSLLRTRFPSSDSVPCAGAGQSRHRRTTSSPLGSSYMPPTILPPRRVLALDCSPHPFHPRSSVLPRDPTPPRPSPLPLASLNSTRGPFPSSRAGTPTGVARSRADESSSAKKTGNSGRRKEIRKTHLWRDGGALHLVQQVTHLLNSPRMSRNDRNVTLEFGRCSVHSHFV
jgi:hypothetical protein